MQDKTIRTSATLSIGMLCGLIAACAGTDTPPRDSELEADIRTAYAGGTRSPAASAGAPGAGGGGSAGARATTGAGGAAPASRGGSGSGGGAVAAVAGGGGDDPAPVAGGGDCDGFALLSRCQGSGCHSAGAPFGGFAESEDAAKGFVGKSGTISCSAFGPLFNPEDPPASIVVRKVNANPPCGGLMPAGSTMPVFSADEIQCLEDWISTL
jgi:hypothetical protein